MFVKNKNYRATNKNAIIVRLVGIKINEYVIINAIVTYVCYSMLL